MRAPESGEEWLVLVHQIPPKPAYLRVKIGRRLARIGSVPLKNSVYLLPARDPCQEDFQWVLREIRDCGGDATLLRAQFVEGLSTPQLRALFNAEREQEYAELLAQTRTLEARLATEKAEPVVDATWRAFDGEVSRLERRLEEVAGRDFFGALGREAVSGLLSELRSQLNPVPTPTPEPLASATAYRNRIWVTRRGVHVDRIASAWLIRRFIDPEAKFEFVDGKSHEPAPNTLRFDMYEAEFTHEADACTFEVLCARFQLSEPGLRAIADMVHDLDLKDDRFCRAETAGFLAQLQGITLLHEQDERRIELGGRLLDALLVHFATKEHHDGR